jgi:hypothetical protein
MKMRHKKMARSAYRMVWKDWAYSIWTPWEKPFTDWHRQFRSVR